METSKETSKDYLDRAKELLDASGCEYIEEGTLLALKAIASVLIAHEMSINEERENNKNKRGNE